MTTEKSTKINILVLPAFLSCVKLLQKYLLCINKIGNHKR